MSDSVATMNHGVGDCKRGCVILARDDRANYGTVCTCDALWLATLRISELSVSRGQRILVLEMACAWIGGSCGELFLRYPPPGLLRSTA